MKNLVKFVITLFVALFLVSIVATISHAQTTNKEFNEFTLFIGGDFTAKGNTKAVVEYNKAFGTNYSTVWEIYTNTKKYKTTTTPEELREMLNPVDSLESTDLILSDLEYTNNYSINLPVYIEAGDIIRATKKNFYHKDSTTLYNITKKLYISEYIIPNPNLVQEIKSPNKEYLYFVYNPTLPIERYERRVSVLKDNWSMNKGKELGYTPKRTDTKYSIPFLAEWNTCTSRREYLGGIFKGKSK